jgi:hypothetical protein
LLVKHHWPIGCGSFFGDGIAFYHSLTYIFDTVPSVMGPGGTGPNHAIVPPLAISKHRTVHIIIIIVMISREEMDSRRKAHSVHACMFAELDTSIIVAFGRVVSWSCLNVVPALFFIAQPFFPSIAAAHRSIGAEAGEED